MFILTAFRQLASAATVFFCRQGAVSQHAAQRGVSRQTLNREAERALRCLDSRAHLTQGLLDLQRLYWNMHPFAAGKRKGSSPYGRLGMVLPKGGWWALLKLTPEQLQQELSALNPAAALVGIPNMESRSAQPISYTYYKFGVTLWFRYPPAPQGFGLPPGYGPPPGYPPNQP